LFLPPPAKSKAIEKDIKRLLSEHSKLGAEATHRLLDGIRSGLADNLGYAEEKVALAEHIHATVQGHIGKLEDDLKHFEEEVRLSRIAAAHRTVAHPVPVQAADEGSGGSRRRDKRARSKEEVVAAVEEPTAVAANSRKRSRAASSANVGEEAVKPERDGKARPGAPSSPNASVEQTYCYCGQPSYGEMIGCDGNEECEIEWFHYGCVGLTTPPKDQWFCPDCTARMARQPVPGAAGGKQAEGSGKPAFV
jgi:hypothetical protein